MNVTAPVRAALPPPPLWGRSDFPDLLLANRPWKSGRGVCALHAAYPSQALLTAASLPKQSCLPHKGGEGAPLFPDSRS